MFSETNSENSSTSTTTKGFEAESSSIFTAAYERRLPDMMAIRESELALMTVDPYTAVMTVLGALARIKELQERWSALRELDRALLEDLADYTLAAAEANSRFRTATSRGPGVAMLDERARRVRQVLRVATEALVERGVVDGSRLGSFKGHKGYENVAFDVLAYAHLLRDCWPQIEGRTAVRKEDVENAIELAGELVLAAGKRKRRATSGVAEAARVRRRAMTLLLRSYGEVRRVIAFLRRREGDGDRIAPSLFAGRGGRGKGRRAAPSPSPLASRHSIRATARS